MIDFPELELAGLEKITDTIDEETYEIAQQIISDVFARGEIALREFAERFDSHSANEPLVADQTVLKSALENLDADTRSLLIRVRDRIEKFAQAQRDAITDLNMKIPGGTAGHRWLPLGAAGCYAPGGRYPLPSSVLMTATTASVAGVEEIWVASPKPNQVTLAAASVAGAKGVIRVGGAQAIAAFAHGVGAIPRCDIIVGPGNRYVTAAKAIVSRQTKIDSLAGPSELVVVAAGKNISPALIAADLLAQSEHDVDARPILITTEPSIVKSVKTEIVKQLAELDTAAVAQSALRCGGFLVVPDIDSAVVCCRKIAPEHLSLQGDLAESNANKFEAGAALFVGSQSAEVFGDYGAGPNHVLPTGGAARSQSALSVINFMRFQTVLKIDDPTAAYSTISDAVDLGRLEGLEAHAKSAEMRQIKPA